jgi:quercetin 2,3-dioxygenase
MIILKRSDERRYIKNENQKTWMTFDSENTTAPLHNGFGALKTFNENVLFPDMELMTFQIEKNMLILTYVREGAIIYKGPRERHGRLSQMEFQLMNVGPEMKQEYGFNASESSNTHVFQIGFALGGSKLEPGEIKKIFTYAERNGVLKLIVSSDGKEDSLPIQQDVQMYSTLTLNGNHMIHELSPGRKAWLHVVKGRILMNDLELQGGDGAGFSHEKSVSFTAQEPTSVLLFDLP